MSNGNGLTNEVFQNFTGGYFKGQQCYLSDPPLIQEGRIKTICLENGNLVVIPIKGKKFTTQISDYRLAGLKLSDKSILLEAFQKGKFISLFFPPQQQVTA